MVEFESVAVSKPDAIDSPRLWLVGGWLFLAAVLASITVLPYAYSVMNQRPRAQPASEWIWELAEGVLVEPLISCLFIAVGLRLRRSLGVGVTLLDNWPPADDEARRRVRKAITLAVVLGLGLDVILAIASHFQEPMMSKPRRPLADPPAWTGLLASIGAAIQEEIWLRLGIMTILVWLGTRIVTRTPPASGVVWTANVLAAAMFGALHIPQAAVLLGPSPLVLAFTLLGNGVPGVLFGWLYWRYGLVAAMICHFAGDILLKVILPLLGIA
jgi:hypothetical protein